jgi:hypothetical protein
VVLAQPEKLTHNSKTTANVSEARDAVNVGIAA